MLNLTMVAASAADRNRCGLLEESLEVVDVTGPGVHNRHHPHRAQRWADRPARLASEPIVIAASPVDRSPLAGTVRTGGRIALTHPGGQPRLYEVKPRPVANPDLVPVDLPVASCLNCRALIEHVPAVYRAGVGIVRRPERWFTDVPVECDWFHIDGTHHPDGDRYCPPGTPAGFGLVATATAPSPHQPDWRSS